MQKTFNERFWEKVEKTETCWLWTASTDGAGYGKIKRGDRLQPAHRVAYELCVGVIPSGLDIDHLCRVPACVNPQHLEPVTRRLNVLRGAQPNVRRRQEKLLRGTCEKGHVLSFDKGSTCATCISEYQAAYRSEHVNERREYQASYGRSYYAQNKERILARQKARQQAQRMAARERQPGTGGGVSSGSSLS